MKKKSLLIVVCLCFVAQVNADGYDLDSISRCLNRCTWTYAKTMPQAPHEYIVRGKCALTDEEFLYIVHAQRDLGIHEVWGSYNFPYLHVDGYKYWTMGDTFENTIILNRQKESLSSPSTWDAKRVVGEYMRLYDSISIARSEGIESMGTASRTEIERLAKAICCFLSCEGRDPVAIISGVFEAPESTLVTSIIAPESNEKVMTELRSAVHDDTLFGELVDGFDMDKDRWTLFKTLLQYRVGCDRLMNSHVMSSMGQMGQRMGTSALRGLYNPILEYIDGKIDEVIGLLLGSDFTRTLSEEEIERINK